MKFITSVFQRFRLVFRDTFEWLLPEILTKVKLKNVMNHIPKFAFCISIQFQRKQKCKLQILLCYNTCHNTWHVIFYNTCHLKKGKEKNWEKLEKVLGKGNYLSQSYHGEYVIIKLLLILILFFIKQTVYIAYQYKILCKVLPIPAISTESGKFANS